MNLRQRTLNADEWACGVARRCLRALVHAERDDRVAYAYIRAWGAGERPRCPAHRAHPQGRRVSDALAREAPTASSLSLLGLIKHAATWEQRWFQVIMAGRQSPDRWPEVMPEPHDAELIIRETLDGSRGI